MMARLGRRSQQQQQTAQSAQSLFALTNGKRYDPDGVYSSSTDGRGHYEQVRVKITPSMEHLIAEVCAEHAEFRSREDFIRNAIFHMLHKYITNAPVADPQLLAVIEAERQTGVMEVMGRIRKGHYENIERAKDQINALCEEADWDGINDLLEMFEGQSINDALPAGIRQLYGDLVEQGRETMMSEVRIRRKRRLDSED